MQELMTTLKAIYEREHRQNKFMASIQGIDIDENKTKEGADEAVTFEEVKARAIAKMTGDQSSANAARFGFDELDGTEYSIVGM